MTIVYSCEAHEFPSLIIIPYPMDRFPQTYSRDEICEIINFFKHLGIILNENK
jgi:hypothetical protein